MAWETFQQCKSLSFFWKGKGRQTSEKKYWFESNSKERWNVTRVALHTSFLKGKGAALWNRLLLRWWKKLNISHKKKHQKNNENIWYYFCTGSVLVSSSRVLLLLGNYFISCSSSMFTHTKKICHNKPLLGHCHYTLPQLPKELFLYTRKWSTVNHSLRRKALALLHIYSKGSPAAISTFKTALGAAFFPQPFTTKWG